MRIKVLFLAILVHSFFLAEAQSLNKYKGSLIYTLGTDTSAIGNFEFNSNNFKLTVVSLIPNVNVSTLNGTFWPDGELKYAEGFNYNPGKGKDSVVYSYKLNYDRDTTFIEIKTSKGVRLRKYPTKIMVANNLGGDAIIFMPALLANFAPKKIGDSIISNHIVFSSARKFIIKRIGDRKLIFGSAVMGMFTLFLDENGKIQSVDGIGTSFNVKGAAGPYLNIDSVIAANLNQQLLHPRERIVNKLDSVKATINATDIKIVYSRPSVRGRVIFGQVVPWNRIWRTGADAATKISLSRSLYLNGKELPAGDYSIFTVPTQTGWALIFNKQADIWGTEHNADYDFLKIPMDIEHFHVPVELLTFEIMPKGSGGILSVKWEKIKASVSFVIKNDR